MTVPVFRQKNILAQCMNQSFCVKDKDNYTFNANEILVEAKTGSKEN
jgi:hypothetical protein